jgi:ribosomal protein L7/L12
MPTWGWFIVALVLVDTAVLAAWFLARRKPDRSRATSQSLKLVGLDDGARAEIHQLLAADKKIQAIKVFRDAKNAIETMQRGAPFPPPSTILDAASSGPVRWDDLLPRLTALKSEGKAIAAIKLLRDRTGLSLRDAKNAVDQL